MANSEIKTVKPGRSMRIALAVSVALNLAVVGVIVGAAFQKDGGPGGGNVRDLGFGPYTEALSREDRAALRSAFLAKNPDLRAARDSMRDDINEVLAALRADPFEPSRLQAALGAQTERMSGQLVTGQQLMSDFFVQMSTEARLGFADRLEAGLRRPRKP